MKISWIISATAIFAASCSKPPPTIQTWTLPQENPISYSFPLSVEEVHAKALIIFSSSYQIDKPIFGREPYRPYSPGVAQLESILAVESFTHAVFSEEIFRDVANTNDIYLHSFGYPFVRSAVYRVGDSGLPYIAAFHLHLASSGSNTIVKVMGLNARVVNGQKFGFGPCGPGNGWVYKDVKPTTVEEYILLRYLGNSLGITNMPGVVLPNQ